MNPNNGVVHKRRHMVRMKGEGVEGKKNKFESIARKETLIFMCRYFWTAPKKLGTENCFFKAWNGVTRYFSPPHTPTTDVCVKQIPISFHSIELDNCVSWTRGRKGRENKRLWFLEGQYIIWCEWDAPKFIQFSFSFD